jgi:predicted phosphoribosyltransferase
MKAAVRGVQGEHPQEVIVAIPIGPQSTCRELEQMGCALVCDQRIDDINFSSVGEWYREFPQVSTEECRELLVRSRRDLKTLEGRRGESEGSSLSAPE